MGLYCNWLGSVNLSGGVLSHKEPYQKGLNAVGIMMPYVLFAVLSLESSFCLSSLSLAWKLARSLSESSPWSSGMF